MILVNEQSFLLHKVFIFNMNSPLDGENFYNAKCPVIRWSPQT